MNSTFSPEQISKTGNLDIKLILRQCNFRLMARFLEIKSVNPKLKQNQIAKKLSHSSISEQRYRNDITMLSPYGIPPNKTQKRRHKILNKTLDDNSNREHDLKRHQMSSKDIN